MADTDLDDVEMVTVRHTKPMVLHFPIELKGKALKAAQDAKMIFGDLGKCRVVWGSSLDESLAEETKGVHPPSIYMPVVVWEALQKHKGYKKTFAALIDAGELVDYRRR